MSRTTLAYLLLTVPLLVSAAPSTSSQGGLITFVGSITRPTSMPTPTGARDNATSLAEPATIQPLMAAQARLHADVLDYFATYAAPDAKIVTFTYY
ncbi:hypothetical protein EO087_07495 [Dyella sp. M7H15-1]|uniref:hypothetical protein n=1 Tax=Dyella sp. M7H15-1 TaxID=2501295 RepID=UPI001004E648|nr:hypothetical protein [Dyella sp. M7H15-1]QAU23851.1 hypothetical protein EO087_07495 [Dyella sp. M7H15-1]